MAVAHKLMNNDDPNTQTRGINCLNNTIESFTNFLEKFGLKEKIAEQLEIRGVVATTEEQKIYEKYYGDKNGAERNTKSSN